MTESRSVDARSGAAARCGRATARRRCARSCGPSRAAPACWSLRDRRRAGLGERRRSARTSAVWHTDLLDPARRRIGITHDLRTWVNSGLMTLFFLVVGLEARREFDLGDLRERRRFVLPFAAGLVGMAIPVLIYLAVNAGRPERARLGRRDVDRHRARARPARAARAATSPTGCGSSCSPCSSSTTSPRWS